MMLSFAASTLRHRKGGFIGAFVALFCAAALVAGCGTLLATGLLGTIAPERYTAAPILVTADQNVHHTESKGGGKVKNKAKPIADRAWLPVATADRLKALPSVGSVVTEVTFPAYLPGGPTADSWGHGWESAPLAGLTIATGRAPAAPGEIVLDATTAKDLHLSAGSTTPVRTATGTIAAHVVGVTAQGFEHQAGVYFAPAEARKLAGHPGLVSAIGVYPAGAATASATASATATATATAMATTAETAAAVTAALAPVDGPASTPPPTVHTGADRGPIEFLDSANARIRLVSMGAVLAGTSLIVALLVVVGTFGLSIQQRQREVALLRAIAATPKQIRKMIGGEALAVGTAAAALGAVAGIPVSAWLHGRFVALGVVTDNLRLVVSPFPLVAAFLATLLAAWGAARISARRATRIRPVEALGEAELKPLRISVVRAVFGVLALAGAVILTFVLTVLHTDAASTPVCFNATLLWCTAFALLGPPLARVSTAVLGAPMRGTSSSLAASNLRAAAHRMASVITPLTLLIAMACTILFTATTTGAAASDQVARGTRADYVIGAKVPADTVAAVRATPGVQSVTEVLHTTVRVGLENRRVQAVTPEGVADTLDLQIREGSLDRLSDTTAAVATGLGRHVGDQQSLTLADGTPTTLRVVATYDRGLGFGDLTLAHDLVARHVDVPLDDTLLVRAPGIPKAALTAVLKNAPGIAVVDQATAQKSQNDAGTKIGYVTLGLIIAFTAIAVLNTLAMTISDRGREFAALRLIGATRRQVLRMLAWEASAIVTVATGLGVGVAFAVLSTYASGMTGTAKPSIPAAMLALVVAGGAVLAVVAMYLPARAALRPQNR